MTELSSKIIDRIKTQEMKPRPKWQFKLRESSKWAVLGVLVIFLGLVAALLWYFLADVDIGVSVWLSHPWTMGHGPGFIVALFLLVSFFSLVWLRQTKVGYRYNIVLAVVLIVIIGIIFAGFFNWLGYGQRLDRSFSMMPFYQNREQFMGMVWQHPEQGRIAGEIIKIEGSTNFILQDLNGKEWAVSSLSAIWRHGMTPELGLRIKILGSQFGGSGFEASDIRPWMPINGSCEMMQNDQGLGVCGAMR